MSLTRIFDIEDGGVKITENCYLIPELKAIIDKYEDPIPAMAYIYYMSAPDSPYANLEDDEKQQIISDDVGGDFSFEDEEIEAGIEKCKKLMYTRTQRLYLAAGKNLDRIAKFLEDTEVEASRDGSGDLMYKWQSNLPKMLENYKKLEKMSIEDQQTKLRGSAQTGMY